MCRWWLLFRTDIFMGARLSQKKTKTTFFILTSAIKTIFQSINLSVYILLHSVSCHFCA